MAATTDSPSALLEHLAALTRCTYLSDLRFLEVPSPAMVAALLATPDTAYPHRSWQEALGYLTGCTVLPGVAGAACRNLLLDYYSAGGIKKERCP